MLPTSNDKTSQAKLHVSEKCYRLFLPPSTPSNTDIFSEVFWAERFPAEKRILPVVFMSRRCCCCCCCDSSASQPACIIDSAHADSYSYLDSLFPRMYNKIANVSSSKLLTSELVSSCPAILYRAQVQLHTGSAGLWLNRLDGSLLTRTPWLSLWTIPQARLSSRSV